MLLVSSSFIKKFLNDASECFEGLFDSNVKFQ